MRIVTTNRELREALPRAGSVVVPTMGALHEGHATLVRRGAEHARKTGQPVVVTVFVNPTQFNEAADFDRYPRTLEADAALCQAAGADMVYAPSVEEVYPPGGSVRPPVLPRVATQPGLEDAHRPGHFAGVCQVVKRLFELTGAATAFFGEKDWQQLCVVRAMVRMLPMDVEIIGVETVREADGLAMSSRNRFLSGPDRRRGLAISRALRESLSAATPEEAEAVMRGVLRGEGLTPEYAVVRSAESLLPDADATGPMRALIAARVGSVRLIDNAAWQPA